MIDPEKTRRPHVLVVDDELTIRDLITACLEAEGMRVASAHGLDPARQLLDHEQFDVVLVDLALGDGNGLTLVRSIKEHTRSGIIIVSSRQTPVDRIVGLEIGADDYITKPFDPRELTIRVRRLSDRIRGDHQNPGLLEEPTRLVYVFADWQFDPPGHSLSDPQGNVLDLTTAESKLLEAFVSRPTRTLSRDHLTDAVHGRDWNPNDRSIDVLIAKLRRKLSVSGDESRFIRTVRGSGYVFNVPVSRMTADAPHRRPAVPVA
jgi:two-component system torCAD operon response regulator TorR